MRYSLTLVLLACATLGFSQDFIHKKDKSIIECKVIEIGLNEIKYTEPRSSGPIISIAVDMVSRVVLESGREIKFNDPLTDPNSYTDDKKRALKVHFLSPLLEHLAFSYEKSLQPGKSIESTVGIIGLGFDTNPDHRSSGLFVSSGIKFLRTPDFYTQRYKYAHILKGAYVKPELVLSVYNDKATNYYYYPNYTTSTEEQTIVAGAFLVNLGKQIIYANSFLIDYSVGIGYGVNSQDRPRYDDYYNYRSNHFGFVGGGADFPVAITAKLKIGLLL